jgi:hypothetical protein
MLQPRAARTPCQSSAMPEHDKVQPPLQVIHVLKHVQQQRSALQRQAAARPQQVRHVSQPQLGLCLHTTHPVQSTHSWSCAAEAEFRHQQACSYGMICPSSTADAWSDMTCCMSQTAMCVLTWKAAGSVPSLVPSSDTMPSRCHICRAHSSIAY